MSFGMRMTVLRVGEQLILHSPIPIDDALAAEKTRVLLHRAAGALVTTDLVLNFDGDDWWTRLYMKISGFNGKPVHSRMLKWTTWSDKRAARKSVRAILDEEWDALVLSHGAPVPEGGKAAFSEAFAWLL